MAGYAKIFSSLFEGSMRGKPDIQLVFINMLAFSPGGICDRTPETIRDETGIPIERVKAAILVLESPDQQSRSPDEEGRRIVRLSPKRDWGWRLVNWEYYRNLLSLMDKREKDAERQRKHRTMSQNHVTGRDASVTSDAEYASVSVPVSMEVFNQVESRLFVLFKRKVNGMPYSEQADISRLSSRPEILAEVGEIERWMPKSKKPPQSLYSLTTQWEKYLDQARVWKPEFPEQKPKLPVEIDVLTYCREKGGTEKDWQFAKDWHRKWLRLGYRKNGFTLDWKVEFSKDLSQQRA